LRPILLRPPQGVNRESRSLAKITEWGKWRFPEGASFNELGGRQKN
jgi:hypothetical protein